MNTSGQVVLVTGSSSGIGRAIAHRFAAQGAAVVVHSRASARSGERVVEEIRNKAGQAIYLRADLEEEDQVRELFARIEERHGRLDVLVNNAGTPTARPFDQTDRTFWLANLSNLFLSAVTCSLEAARVMRAQRGGSILNITSVRALDHAGRPASMAYSAAKAALANFTRNLAKELAPAIRVNAVAPGFVAETSFLDRAGAALQEQWLGETPLRRFVRPEEVAEACAFLAAAPSVTGEVLVMDGGFNLKLC